MAPLLRLPESIVLHIASGALVRVLDRWCPPFAGFDIYVASRSQMPAKLRALIDFLTEKRGHHACF